MGNQKYETKERHAENHRTVGLQWYFILYPFCHGLELGPTMFYVLYLFNIRILLH
jgi:hypothetical protein